MDDAIGITNKAKKTNNKLLLDSFHFSTDSLPGNFSSIKAVIFDCDGTLVDSEEFHYLAWQAAFQKYGHTFEEDFYMKYFSGLGDVEIANLITQNLNFKPLDALIACKHAYFDEFQAKGIIPISSTIEFAKSLFEQKKKLGLKLAVASAAKKEEILCNLKSLQIEHYFDVILSGRDDLKDYKDETGTNKPKPYVYLKTIKMLGLEPKECIAIEDSTTGVSAAVAAGCFTVAIPNHYTKQHDLSHAHLKISSFAGINGYEFLKMIQPH